MALLEIDDIFLRDERFSVLGELAKTGKHDVRSRVLSVWYDCIEKTQDVRTGEEIDILTGWFESDRGAFADLMVKAKLAEKTKDGYRIRGVRERMKWLVELREKRHHVAVLGGNARAKNAKRGDAGQFQPSQDQQEPASDQLEAGENQPSPAHTAPAPAPDSVPVPASVSAPAENLSKAPAGVSSAGQEQEPAGGKPTAPVWKAYRDAYEVRHKTKPVWNAQTGGQLKKLLSRIPREAAPAVAAFYLTHNDSFYVRKMHPVGLLLHDAEKLHSEWVTGRRMTSAVAREGEKQEGYQDQFRRIAEGTL